MFSLRSPLIIVCENTWRIQRSYAHENYKKTMQAVYYCFHRAGKQSTNIMFSLHSPLITLWENAWKMQRSRARENYEKTFRKTSCTLAFSWSRKTIEKHHVFMAFTVSNSVWKMLGKCSVCAWENYGKTSRKTSYTLAYSWSRKTIDKYHVFMTLTVSNSVGKHVENEAFAHTGKLQKNFQENRLFIGIFLVQGNM